MDKKLTDSEIVKALECCGSPCNICAECPMPNDIKDDCKCGEHLANYALDLINRLQAKLNEAEDTIQFADKELKKANAENEKLNQMNFDLCNAGGKLLHKVETIKAEAYKECIEKVKEKSKKTEIVCSGALITISYAISNKNLDNLLKELVEEQAIEECEN